MEDKPVDKARKEELQEMLRFFSEANKRGREVCVVREFLRTRGVQFDESELKPVDDEAPDVIFRDARFEVKELLDPGRKRTDEIKKLLECAEKESTKQEVAEFHPIKRVEPVDIYKAVEAKCLELTEKYEPAFRRTLDLLLYYDLHDYFRRTEDLPDTSALSRHGFRSVSIIRHGVAWVLWAESDAPEFLLENKG